MPIRGCYCQKVDQKFSKMNFVENFANCMNGECDDGCGIPLICERRDALWSVAIVGYYCRVIMIVIVLHIV